MEIQEYLLKKADLQESLLKYLNDYSNTNDTFIQLKEKINLNNIPHSREELSGFLYLISNISNNHHRSPEFIKKIEDLLCMFTDEIKQSFSNHNIFTIFKENKRILFYLFKNKIIIPSQEIFDEIKSDKYKEKFYLHYFYKELNSFYSANLKESISKEPEMDLSKDDFDEKRRIGENCNYVYHLIRQDNINEFIEYFKKENFSLSSEIKNSIFETNPFLIKNKTTLIEYCAFFGAVNIFKYLIESKVKLTSSLWNYGIHSNNFEIIQLLQQNNVKTDNIETLKCLTESVICHHIEMSNYFFNNLISYQKCQNINFTVACINCYNYKYFIFNLSYLYFEKVFYYLCKLNFAYIVELLLTRYQNQISINPKENKILFFYLMLH